MHSPVHASRRQQPQRCCHCNRLCLSAAGLARHQAACGDRQPSPQPAASYEQPAFILWPNHIPALLDFNFAEELRQALLHSPRMTPAVAAFAAQLEPA